MTALLEYILTALLEYIDLLMKRAHVPSVHPSLKDEGTTINCCTVSLLLAAKLNSVLGSYCKLKSPNFTGDVS